MNQPFYQVKGALPANAPSYIKRDADDKLYNALIENKYCYILNYRQIGKSSLKNNCAKRLEDVGYRCVHIDLTGIGSRDIEVEQWYSSFMFYIVRQLNLSEEVFINYWFNTYLTVGSRIELIMNELILKECQEKITIFIDEIDFILSINKFNTDNFFALIRRFYNLRGEDERYKRLTFVLLGVASPNDLMRDSSRTPFNIAENIKISQLKLEQSYGLIEGLENQTIDKKEILKKVFEYTSGTSFLTQKILEYIAKNPIKALDDIEIIVDKLFIQESFNEVNLSNVQERIIKNQTHNVKMLYTLEQIQNGIKIEYDGRRQTFIYLKLSGLIKEEDGVLVYSNLIYKRIFNASWLGKMIGKLDRPIIKYLQEWEKNGMSKSYLLKEETLKEIDKWAFQRNDVLAKEHEYISLSHQEKNRKDIIKFEEERQKYNKKLLKQRKESDNKLLEEEKKSNKKLLRQKKKSTRWMRLLVLTFLLSVVGTFYSNYSKYKIIEEQQKLAKEKLAKEKLEVKVKLESVMEEKEIYYQNLLKAKLKGGTEEYYLWEISTYEHLDDNQTNYKIAEASTKLGDLYNKNNRPNDAQKYYTKAIHIYKNSDKYQEELADLYCKLGYPDGAIMIYNKNKYKEKYKVKRAEIYYKMVDKAISLKDAQKAKELYNRGFEIYRNLLQKKTNTYVSVLIDTLVKQANISLLNKNKKEAKKLYIRALNIYKQLNIKSYHYKIDKIKNKLKKLKDIKLKTKHKEGWVYIGEFVENHWNRQYFWLKNSNTLKLKGSKAIAVSGVKVRKDSSPHSKEIDGISMGSLVTIAGTINHQKENGTYVWAYVKY